VRKLGVVLLVIVLAALLFSCYTMESGTVVGKEFVPAHTNEWLYWYPLPKGGGFYIPMTDHIPDKWYITLEDTDEEYKKHSQTIEVSQEKYKRINVGDRYYLPGETKRLSN